MAIVPEVISDIGMIVRGISHALDVDGDGSKLDRPSNQERLIDLLCIL